MKRTRTKFLSALHAENVYGLLRLQFLEIAIELRVDLDRALQEGVHDVGLLRIEHGVDLRELALGLPVQRGLRRGRRARVLEPD